MERQTLPEIHRLDHVYWPRLATTELAQCPPEQTTAKQFSSSTGYEHYSVDTTTERYALT